MLGSILLTSFFTSLQEGYAAKYGLQNEGENDSEMAMDDNKPMDPMQGLEGLAEAGPRQQ